MNPSDYFSTTMPEADAKFAAACARAGIEPSFFVNPRPGPGGEELRMGVAVCGPKDATNRLVIISATHGIEGYAGAGIQVGVLQNWSDFSLPDDTAVVLVHMLNPWGVAWDRRENEDNVDIFRNLIYCDDPSEADELYDLLAPIMSPRAWSEDVWKVGQDMYAALAKHFGRDRLILAHRKGQHHNPKGQQYHGNGPTWSKTTFDFIIDEHLAGARRIGVLDIHTGFGDYGVGMITSYCRPETEKFKRIMRWVGGAKYYPGDSPHIPRHDKSFPFDFIEKRVPGSEVTAGVLEYGTVPPITTPHIWPANLYFHMYGDPLSPEGRAIAKEYRAFCYQEKDDWKNSVWERGREVVQNMLDGMGEWVAESAY
ncbi:MAG: DUF2817 domain-containing protein [Candidatus Hydrogenedentota bacterium]